MYTRTISFDSNVDVAALPNHLADCLRGVDARAVEITGDRVTFTGGAFRLVSNWNVLFPFGFGDLTINSATREVRYRLSFRQLMIGAAASVGLMGIFIVSMSFAPSLWESMAVLLVMWTWLVGGNLAIGISRFQTFMSNAIATAPKRASKSNPTG